MHLKRMERDNRGAMARFRLSVDARAAPRPREERRLVLSSSGLRLKSGSDDPVASADTFATR